MKSCKSCAVQLGLFFDNTLGYESRGSLVNGSPP
jgi:hypothetical protein